MTKDQGGTSEEVMTKDRGGTPTSTTPRKDPPLYPARMLEVRNFSIMATPALT